MWKSLSFRCPGGGFGLHFGRLVVTLGSLCQVFLGYRKEVGILTDFDGFWLPWGIPVPRKITQDHARFGWSALTRLQVYMRPKDRQEDRRHEDRQGKTAKDQQTHYGLKARWRIIK